MEYKLSNTSCKPAGASPEWASFPTGRRHQTPAKWPKKLAAIALLLVVPTVFAKSYELRRNEPEVGSNIRRVIGSTSIPLDRRISELPPQEQAEFRSSFKSLAPNDEPPFPVGDLKPLAVKLTQLQHLLKINGELSLLVRIGPDGVAQSISVLKSPNDNLQKLVSLMLLDVQYQAPKCAGVPCEMEMPFTLVMQH